MKRVADEFFSSIPSRFHLNLLWTDRGQEYRSIASFLKKKFNVKLYHVRTDFKCSIAERKISSIKNRLYKVLFYTSSLRWLEYIQGIQDSLNNTRSVYNFTPNEIVGNKEIEKKVARKFALEYVNHELSYNRRPRLTVGTLVRHVLPKSVFHKAYKSNFSDKMYKIERIVPSSPPMYFLQGLSQPYYFEQLAVVAKDTSSTGEERRRRPVFFIARTRRLDGRETRSGAKSNQVTQYLVKSVIDKSFSHWLSESEVEKLRKNGGLLRRGFIRE